MSSKCEFDNNNNNVNQLCSNSFPPPAPQDEYSLQRSFTQPPAFEDVVHQSFFPCDPRNRDYDIKQLERTNTFQWLEPSPNEPRLIGHTIGRSFLWRIWETVIAFGYVAAVLPFLILAGVAARLHGQEISEWGDRVRRYAMSSLLNE